MAIQAGPNELECSNNDAYVYKSLETRNIRNVILDCDPGIDDEFAILWMLSQYKKGVLNIHAITTTQGNSSPFDAFRNVLHMIDIATTTANLKMSVNEQSEILIGKMDKSKEEEDKFQSPDNYYAADGVANLSETFFKYFPIFSSLNSAKELFNNALTSSEIIVDALVNNPYTITIVAIGPLSNLMLAEKLHPGILSFAREIIIMGGSVLDKWGNSEGLAEFNFLSDTQSLHAFFATINSYKRAPNVMLFPLDITRTLHWTSNDLEIIYDVLSTNERSDIDKCRTKMDEIEENLYENVNCSQPSILYLMLEIWTQKMNRKGFEYGDGKFFKMHDSATVGYMLYPHLFDFKHVFLRIEAESTMTWFDRRNVALFAETMTVPNVFVALNVQSSTFIKLMTRDLLQLMTS